MHMAPIVRDTRASDPMWVPLTVVLGLALGLAAINPGGYIGGGSDDWQYLEAARCVVREGFCVPASHWAARLPIVLPTAAAIATFGESRASIMLVPLIYGLAAITLFVAVMARACGRTAATLGGIALVATPMVGGELIALNVSTVEFAWMIAAVFAGQRALRASDARWAFAAGALVGLAILSRATAFACLPILGLGCALLPREQRRLIAPAALGLVAMLAAEGALHLATAGDPLHGWRLALGHTRLASSEGAGVAGSPLFNPTIIAGWERSMGIRVHWTVDGALNLLADPTMAPTLWAALVLLFLARTHAGRAPMLLLVAAALYFGGLVYGLSVDPKPRMFVPVAAAACAIAGICGAHVARNGGRPLLALMGVLLAANAAALAYNKLDLSALERTAAACVTPGTAVDETARRVLTLVPAIRRLPTLPTPQATRLLTVSTGACVVDPGWHLLRVQKFGMTDPPPLAALRARGLLLGPVAPLALCQFARR